MPQDAAEWSASPGEPNTDRSGDGDLQVSGYIHSGDPITFKVQTFNTTHGHETWDFGDGTPPVDVQSDGNAVKLAPDGYAETVHRYEQPGDYIVSVERTNEFGIRAVGHLHVRVTQ